ncbi:VUT family protein [Mycobacteroides abscessus subsp. bolletii]|uniref:VUT family protein n=1 Tax=Mycobacteroides abscessus TaxID=36809 RepID=UPI0019D10A99|nr:VUT family protein [Mycobacteroides abscessus]MBN7300816.1 VUT family protein [Mycobacteroides abscessus subsp. bolletii]
MITAAWVIAFVGCIAGANWAILHVGAVHGPDMPRTIPVGLGLAAPSGVLFAGAQLTLRDLIHERLGARWTLVVIAASAPLTMIVASAAMAVASIVTFLAAEAADLAVYSRLRRRGYVTAVLGSNLVSALVDSMMFLTLAFGAAVAVSGAAGMTVGKLEASVVTLAVVGVATGLARMISSPSERVLARA